jgi:hypothetical protein
MDIIRRDIREIITDIISLKVSINSLPDKERKEMWGFVLQEISGIEKYMTREQEIVIRNVFLKMQ